MSSVIAPLPLTDSLNNTTNPPNAIEAKEETGVSVRPIVNDSDNDSAASAEPTTTTTTETPADSTTTKPEVWVPTRKRPLLAWTVFSYRRPGLSEEEYHRHMSEVHAPLVKHLMVKYGFVQWSMTHNTTETRALMAQLVGHQFNATSEYDCVVQCRFRSVDDFVRMKQDPFYKEHIVPDHERFADTTKSKMTVGWIEDHLRDGAIVPV